MKHTLLFTILAALLAAGCTTREQDEQIKAFWQEQTSSVLGRPMMPPTLPELPAEFTLPEQNPEETQPVPAEEAPAAVPATTEATQQPAQPAAPQAALKAFLFVHADSPLCKQLKADQWDKQFQQKYQGKVTLVEYDMINPASKEPLRQLMRKHQMPSLTVPILFIGNRVLPGYPFQGVDEAVQKALAAPLQANRTARKRTQPTQYMEIIMEDSPKQAVNTKASPRDRRAMQLAIASVQQSNQQAVQDIGTMFGNDTQAAAFAIIARTERLLKNKAASSPDYKTYLATQKSLLALQEKDLNQLMRQNARNIRSIRG